MADTVPSHPHTRPAADLAVGMTIGGGFLPLMKTAELLFVYPYTISGARRVCVVYLYRGRAEPVADDFRADSLIPVTGSL